MRSLSVCFLFPALIAISYHGLGQSTPSSAPASPKLESVKLYNGAQGLTAASLLPLQVQGPVQNECKGKNDSGDVSFSFIVDANGKARNIAFDRVHGDTMDYVAVRVMESDRFQAATLNGVPVAVSEVMKMRLELCVETAANQGGAQGHHFRLRALPEQELVTPSEAPHKAVLAPIPDPQAAPTPPEKVGNSVSPPHLLNFPPQVEFSDYARLHNIQGECEFSMIVDEHGLPQDIKIVTPMEASLLRMPTKQSGNIGLDQG